MEESVYPGRVHTTETFFLDPLPICLRASTSQGRQEMAILGGFASVAWDLTNPGRFPIEGTSGKKDTDGILRAWRIWMIVPCLGRLCRHLLEPP